MEWVNSSSSDFASIGGQVITYIFQMWSEAQPNPDEGNGLDGAYMDYHAYYGYYGAVAEGYYEGDYVVDADGYYGDGQGWYYYGYYFPNYYMGQYEGYGSTTSTTTPPPTSVSLWSAVRQCFYLATTCCLCARGRAFIPRMTRVLMTLLRASMFGRLLSQCAAALACDSREIVRALIRCLGDIALVLVSRSPRAVRHLRGPILRFRSMLDLELTEEDEVLVRDGDSYKPLLMIQQGGRRARWGGRRRWSQIRSRAFRTYHSPTVEGDCLFSSFQFVAQRSGCGCWSVKKLRKMVQCELERISSSSELVHGRTLSHWAGKLNMTEKAFIDNCTGPQRRWGNTLDLFLLARLFAVNLRAIDTKTGSSLMFHRAHSGVVWCIGLANRHFTVLRRHYHEGTLRNAAADGLIAQGGMQGAHGDEAHDGCIIVDPLLDTCVLDGSTQTLGNEDHLRELCEEYHDLDEEAGSPRPEPVDWLQLEDEWSRQWLLDDLRKFLPCFQLFSMRALPKARQWKQYIRTPPQFSINDGGASSSACSSSEKVNWRWYAISALLTWHNEGGWVCFVLSLIGTVGYWRWQGPCYSFAPCSWGTQSCANHWGVPFASQGTMMSSLHFEMRCGGTNTSMPPPPVPLRRRVETQTVPRPCGVAKVAKVVDNKASPVKAKAAQQPRHGSAASSSSKSAVSQTKASSIVTSKTPGKAAGSAE
eukprot:2056236-Amphidinium_carterae.1